MEAILVRKCHTFEDFNYSWTELNTDIDEISPWSRLYQPEAFEPSGPGWVFWGFFGTIFFCFFPFFAQPPYPHVGLNSTPAWRCICVTITGIDESKCQTFHMDTDMLETRGAIHQGSILRYMFPWMEQIWTDCILLPITAAHPLFSSHKGAVQNSP